MQKWGYKIISGYSNEATLNQLGEQGWEVIAVAAGGAEKTGERKENFTGWGAQDVYVYLKCQK
jgi:hypothetical protein